MFGKVYQWLLPRYCCLCGQQTLENTDLCSFCVHTLPWVENRCYRCGLLTEGKSSVLYCEVCEKNPPNFDRLCALFSYEEPVVKLILGLKFGRELTFGKVLGEILADQVVKDWYKHISTPEAIIPIPLHKKRLRTRGYNQSLELLWPVKKRHGFIILNQVCQRIRETKPQSGLKKEQRYSNLKRAFKVIRPLNLTHVAIMDDVVTTGCTVNALSVALKEVGVEQVDVWCICRA